MAREPEDAVMRILQQIQSALADHGRKLDEHTKRFDQIDVQLQELRDGMVTSLGLSAHANVRHDNVQRQIEEPRRRVELLEEKA